MRRIVSSCLPAKMVRLARRHAQLNSVDKHRGVGWIAGDLDLAAWLGGIVEDSLLDQISEAGRRLGCGAAWTLRGGLGTQRTDLDVVVRRAQSPCRARGTPPDLEAVDDYRMRTEEPADPLLTLFPL